ncbi:hypothetical protein DBV15_04795 [Temnothorax longispinosus]|uniref:Uncharacterized protein n=1 Tax=Temnothorax longispinosus TaxID=300112 RepID=A0A4S2JSR6_9HYME|nr:hypothetical protein DBV15_04795 [Temnothorax longispinosus]
MRVHPDVASVCVNSAARAYSQRLIRGKEREREKGRVGERAFIPRLEARKDHPDYTVHTTGRAHREQFKGERSKRSVFTPSLLQTRNFHCPPCPSACAATIANNQLER